MLEPYLQDLESRLNPIEDHANLHAWLNFLDDRCPTPTFTPPRRTPSPPKIPWPTVSVNQAFHDPQLMLLQQFASCSQALESGSTSRLCVRCNYGTPIIPSLFGAQLFMMEESTNTLPTSHPLGSPGRGGGDRVRALLDHGIPNPHSALGSQVFNTAELFLSTLQKHPLLAQHIALYHPDVQGPIDIAEMIWGSDIFYAFYEDPPLLRDLLHLITQTYITFMQAWYKLVPQTGPYSTHWGLMHRGTLMLRNDSLMNLSPQAYIDFIRPHDQKLLNTFGGGAIHFCGRGDHFIHALATLQGLTAINLTQPHLNNMDIIYQHTIDRQIKLLGLAPAAAQSSTRPLLGQVHVSSP